MLKYGILVVLLAAVPITSAAQITRLDWATFPVERERTGTSGDASFDGVGMLKFSPETKSIEFKGFRSLWLPYRWQEENDKFEFRMESFVIETLVPIRHMDEYAFAATTDFTAQRVTGTIRVTKATALEGSVLNFEMLVKTVGFAIRYRLVRSTDATAMLKKYDDIFFGRNYAWFRPTGAR